MEDAMANQTHRTFALSVAERYTSPVPWTLQVQPRPNSQLAFVINLIAQQVAERVEEQVLEHLEQAAPRVQPVLLSVKDAAIYLGRSEQAIQHLIFSHELPVVRVGRRVHLDRRDLDLWIEKNKY
jgi:excisionase family DNA binding protein